jgi:hypothetical protein
MTERREGAIPPQTLPYAVVQNRWVHVNLPCQRRLSGAWKACEDDQDRSHL